MQNEINETKVVLDAFIKGSRKRVVKTLDEKQATLLQKIRNVYMSVTRGFSVLVVTEIEKDFEEVFQDRSEVMRIFLTRGLISIKTVSEVTVEDLELNIIEI